jgi:hypothetical protein
MQEKGLIILTNTLATLGRKNFTTIPNVIGTKRIAIMIPIFSIGIDKSPFFNIILPRE